MEINMVLGVLLLAITFVYTIIIRERIKAILYCVRMKNVPGTIFHSTILLVIIFSIGAYIVLGVGKGVFF